MHRDYSYLGDSQANHDEWCAYMGYVSIYLSTHLSIYLYMYISISTRLRLTCQLSNRVGETTRNY